MFIGFLPSVGRLEGTLDRASDISRKKKQNFAEKWADFAGKKSKFAEQSANFAEEKSKFAEKSADFTGF